MIYPEELRNLIDNLQKIPGIGQRSAQRYALALIEEDEETVIDLSNSLIDAKRKLHSCEVCGFLTDQDICHICSDESRDQNTICILEDYKSIFAFENSQSYSGTYHVLKGLISPIDGIGPDDINLKSLQKRVEKLDNVELIIALRPNVEGEATTMYINKMFAKNNIKISRLPYGIPIGAEIEYMDPISLDRAMNDRKVLSEY